MDDHALSRALATGDGPAFQALVERETASVFRMCYRILGRIDEAEDATQEVFVLAFRALPSYRGDGPPGAWLQRIAMREAWRRSAARSRRMAASTPLDETVVASLADRSDPLSEAIAAQERALVRKAVASLPEPYREVIALRFFGELTLLDICAATGRPEGTVKAQIHRGLQRLRERLETAHR